MQPIDLAAFKQPFLSCTKSKRAGMNMHSTFLKKRQILLSREELYSRLLLPRKNKLAVDDSAPERLVISGSYSGLAAGKPCRAFVWRA